MKTRIVYFSATGNTARAVGLVEARLRDAGQEVETFNLDQGPPDPSLAGVDRLMVAFPVLAFGPPALVSRFLTRLPSGRRPDGSRIPALVLAVDGGGGGPAASRAAARLIGRGYEVVLTGAASYPENWIQVGAVPATPGLRDQGLATGDRMAGEFADLVLAGTRARHRVGLGLNLLLGLVSFLFATLGRRFLGIFWYADQACNGCGLCERTCPAATIVMGRGPDARPWWKRDCEACNRCANVCPTGAIHLSVASLALHLGAITGLSVAGSLALGPWANPVTVTLMVGLAHLVCLGPLEAWVFRPLRRVRALDGLFAATWTRGLTAYTAPGFKPAVRRTGSA